VNLASVVNLLIVVGAATYLFFLVVMLAVIVRTKNSPAKLTPEDIADHRENCANHCKDCMYCSGPTLEDQREWAEMSRD